MSEEGTKAPDLAQHVQDAVENIASLHERARAEGSNHVRRFSRMSALLGSPTFFVVVISVVVTWVGSNLAAPWLGRRALDAPPFPLLQGLISLVALLVAILVLIAQNRQGRRVEHRARLDLQINLLAERKIAKLVALLEELRHDLPNVRNRVDREAAEMIEPVDTHAVLTALETELAKGNRGSNS